METNNEEEIKRIVKKTFPQMVALAKDRVCPSEDALAAFAEGKLKGRKEEEVISHLAVCNDCLETIRFLRQAPSEEEIPVPAWLEKTVCDLFPEKPKTWKIAIEHAKTALEVIGHTAAQCFTIPGFELVPARAEVLGAPPDALYLRTADTLKSIRESDLESILASEYWCETASQEFPPVSAEGFGEPTKDLYAVPEERFLAEPDEQLARPALVSAARDKILKGLRKKISNGFLFSERIGPFKVYLVVAKHAGKRPHIFEVAIVVHDRSGNFAEGVEISFLQGRKAIDKLMTTKKGGVSKSLAPQHYTVKFKYKGLNLGKAFLDLREERAK